MPKRIDKLFWELELDAKQWEGGLADAERAAGRFIKYLEAHPFAVVGAFSAALVGIGVKAEEMAAHLQTAMAKVQTAAGVSEAALAKLREGVLDTFQRTAVDNLDDLTQGLYDLISAGIPADQALADLQVAAKLSVGGFTSTAVAVDGLTSVLNAFKDQGLTAQHAADAFFQSAKIGKTTVGELSQSIGSVAPIADALGVSLDDLLANITALSLKGVKTDEAFVGIRGVLTNILKPASQFAQQFPELAAQFDRTRLKAEGLTNFLVDLAKATKGNDEATTLLFGDVRALNAVMALTADGGKGVKEILDQITHSAGATAQAYETVADTQEKLWQVTKNQLNVALERLGTKILPPLTDEVRGWVYILNGFKEAVDEIDQTAALRGQTTEQLTGAANQVQREIDFLTDKAAKLRADMQTTDTLRFQQDERELAALNKTLAARQADLALIKQILAARQKPAPPPPPIALTPEQLADRGAAGASRALGGPRVVGVPHNSIEATLLEQALPSLQAVQAQFDKLSGSIDLADAKAAAFGGAVGQAGQAALPTLDLLISRTEAQVAATKEGTKEHDAAVKLLEEELRLRAQIVQAAKDASGADQSGADAHAQRIEQLREEGRQIQAAADGAIQLAKAFGLVDDRTAAALDNIAQIAANLPAAAKGDVSSIINVIGNTANLIKGLFGHSAQDDAAKKLYQANTDALQNLARHMGDLAHALITGNQIGALQQVVRQVLSGGDFAQALASAGLSRAQFTDLAKEFGIDITTSNRGKDLIASLTQLQQALATGDLSSVTDTYADALQHLKDSFEVNDITDPVQQLTAEIAALKDPTTGIPALANLGLDASSTQARAASIAKLQQLFNDLAAGRVTAAQLGGASIEQTNAAILDLINQLRGIDQAGGPAGTGGFSVDRSITEVTGSRLAGLLTTGNVYQRLTAQNTALIAQVLAGTSAPIPTIAPPALPSSATSGPGGVTIQAGGINVTVNITRAAGGSPVDPAAITAGVKQATLDAINQGLGDRYRQTQRARGQVPVI